VWQKKYPGTGSSPNTKKRIPLPEKKKFNGTTTEKALISRGHGTGASGLNFLMQRKNWSLLRKLTAQTYRNLSIWGPYEHRHIRTLFLIGNNLLQTYSRGKHLARIQDCAYMQMEPYETSEKNYRKSKIDRLSLKCWTLNIENPMTFVVWIKVLLTKTGLNKTQEKGQELN